MSAPARAGRLAQRDRGAITAELVLVVPVLLLLTLGMIDCGRLMTAQVTLTQAAREGARSQASGVAPQAGVLAAAKDLSGVRVEAGAPCVAGAASTASATVTTRYTFEFVTPVGAVAGLLGPGFSRTRELTGTAVMPCLP